ncbi:Protein detoxification 14 [Vitis vinifera]|uniref:Protein DETOXIFICATION n=1 Tax=Vitis vinifera TaxID=29760 RepID=A0A438HTJ2_VITVI|nr:Protein detoxification 14 [Vitis vinifera]
MGVEKMQLGSREEKRCEEVTWGGFAGELKKVGCLAAPMVVATVSQYLLQVASVVMVGHLGQVSLSAVAIATALTNVTGFSLLVSLLLFSNSCHERLAGGLETLCGQAYGAHQYGKLGIYTYSATISLALVCLPICLLWIFMDKLLILIGQDPLIAHEARNYSIWLIPGLYGSAILKPLVRYLQTQSLIFPMLISSLIILGLHIPICWSLVFKLELGNVGAAVAISISSWLNVVLLVLYVKYSSACEKTRMSFSKDAFFVMGEFFHFAVPAAVILKWWSCELLTLLSGLLPNPKLESSILAICLTITTLHFTIPYGLGAVASTRVSNELGAGNPQAARVAVWAVMFLAIIETTVVSTTLFCCRYVLGYAYSQRQANCGQRCSNGSSDLSLHCHGQHTRSSFWLVPCLPCTLFSLICFSHAFKSYSTLLSIITGLTNWKKQANKARERIFEGPSSVENRSELNEPKRISDEVVTN